MSDLFVNGGEASSAQSSAVSLQTSTLELLGYLIAELQRREMESRLKKQEEEQQQEESSQAEETDQSEQDLEFSADGFLDGLEQKTMAVTALAVLEEFGQSDRYQAESYTIKIRQDEAQPVYSVLDQDFNEVLRFEKLGEEILIVEDGTTTAQRAEFVKAGENLAEKGAEAINRDPTSKTQLEKLGDLAPAGSKAVFVAHYVLEQTGQNTYRSQNSEGQADRYTFSRDDLGAITIHDNHEGYDILQVRDGKILQALSQENAQHFQALYEKVKDADISQSRQPELAVPSQDSPTQPEVSPTSPRQKTRDRTVEERTQTLDRELEIEAPSKPPAPTPAELSEWLLASKVLGRGDAQVKHVKKLGREGAEGTGKDFKELYREGLTDPLPMELSSTDYEQMQKDLRQFRDLLKERGSTGVAQIYQAQTTSESPVNITDNSQIKFKSEAVSDVKSTVKKTDLER
ncbi:hypothetical protein ACKFKF_18915 [Phormidesmis sp. 146-12]